MRTDDLLGALWLPEDAKVNPADVTQALAKGARQNGARIFEQTRVTAIHQKDGVATGVSTSRGDIKAEVVINCAGQWAKQVGRMADVTVPLHSAEHMYIVTGRIDGVHPDLPVLRDPDGYIYVKEEVGGLLMGGFEPVAKPWAMDGIPENFEFGMLPDDWDQFQILMENALIRLPALETAEIKTFMNGPESFTPDNNFIMGEAPELKNFYVAAGFNSIGIASGGGAGRALAEWIVQGEPTLDLWPVDIRRFARFHDNDRLLKERVSEVLGLHYKMPWPNRELLSARPLRCSPLYDRLAAQNALFGSKMGWERPNFFAPGKDDARIDYSWERQNWFPYAAAEHKATRETVTITDLTSFAKFLVQGRDAEAVLQRLCANDVAVPVGQTVYTGVAQRARHVRERPDRRAARRRSLPARHRHRTGDARRGLDRAQSRRRERNTDRCHVILCGHCRDGAAHARSAVAAHQSAARQCGISVRHDPRNRHRLRDRAGVAAHLCRRAWLGALRPGRIRGRRVRCVDGGGQRISAARNAGYYAVESLRLEKAYRAWGRELTPDYNPYEAGLSFAVKLDKGDFLGRDALLAAKGKPPARRLLSFVAASPDTPIAHGGELILRNGEPAGETTSAAYGHTVGGIVALGYVATGGAKVDDAWLAEKFEIDIAGERVPVRASLKAPYDPSGARLKG